MLTQWSKLPENAVSDEPDELPFNEDWVDAYLRRVYDGDITKTTLDPRYHELTGGYLMKGVQRGYKGRVEDFDEFSELGKTIRDIRRNIYQFSAAKQYQQVQVMSEFIHDAGLKATFSDFKKLAGKVFEIYNKNYLKAEFVTAVGQAQSARDWTYFFENKDRFPWLKYHTQLDSHVRDQHMILEGYTAKVDDVCWRHIAPKNGWRCRCYLTAHETGNKSTRQLPEFGTSEFPAVFDMNPGIDRLIFNPKKHPYFFVEKGDADLKKANFNLTIP